MSSQENQSGSKPAIFTIGTVVILFFVSLMLQNSENPFVNFIANLYLFSYHLEFSKDVFCLYCSDYLFCSLHL